jgi:plastocyanin
MKHIHQPRGVRAAVFAAMAAVAINACGGAALQSQPAGSSPTPADSALTASPSSLASASASRTPTTPQITPMPSAPDSGVKVTLVAKDHAWDLAALTVPANKVWHLTIDNQDPKTPHNFAVSANPGLVTTILAQRFEGVAKKKFEIPGLPAGSYIFTCSIHPQQMKGDLTVE